MINQKRNYDAAFKAKRLKEIDDKISVHEVIDDLCQVKIVKLRYEETEFLVRTELKGKAYLAFKAVGIRCHQG